MNAPWYGTGFTWKGQKVPIQLVKGQPVKYLEFWTGEWQTGIFVQSSEDRNGITRYLIRQVGGRTGLFTRDQIREGSTD